jgi:ABC-type multidrug transport system permease subunit
VELARLTGKSGGRASEVLMRFLLRLASLVALAVAVIAGTIDSIQSVAASAVVVTPMGDAWQELSPSSLLALQSSVSYYVHPRFYAFVFQWLMLQPAFAVFLAIALLLWMIGYKKPPVAGRFTA